MAKFTARTTNPTKDNKFYYTDVNPWVKKGIGSCTCYAQGRILELENASFGTSKKKYKDTWYPVDMFNRCSEVGAKKCASPVIGGGVVWKSAELTTGHIAIIEKVDGDVITFSQWDRSNTFATHTAKKSDGYKYNGYDLVGFFDCQFKWDAETPTTEDYSKNTIPNRFKVKKDGKQIEADTIYSNATNTADKVCGIVVDGTNGKTIYTAKQTAPQKTLTAKSYPNYTNGKSFYRIRKSWADAKSQIGAYSVWEYGFNCYTKNKANGYHIFDDKGNKLE